MAGRARPDPTGETSRLRVFVDIADPRARRRVREALARDPVIRFVSAASAADVVVGDTTSRARSAGTVEREATRVAGDVGTESDEATTGGATAVGALTDRETEVLQALAEGLSNRAIAERFGISRSTVKFHLHAVFEKLGVHARAEAVAAGVRRGHVLL